MVKVKMLAAALAVVGAMVLGGVQAAQASPVRGSVKDVDVLSPGDTATYKIALVGGEPTEMAVVGDGSSPLQVSVFDGDGNLIGSKRGDVVTISLHPSVTSFYFVKVTNVGFSPVKYAFAAE
jgi:hypothetical protein